MKLDLQIRRTTFTVWLRAFLLSFLLAAHARASAQTNPFDQWTWRNPVPPNEPVAGLAYGNGLFVAVAVDGSVLNSSNGVAWVGAGKLYNQNLASVCFADNQFVAVSSSRLDLSPFVATSPDGVHWLLHQVPGTAYFDTVTAGKGIFVAMGNSSPLGQNKLGAIWTSSDTTNWTQRTSHATKPLFGATYGNGLFVGVGDVGTIVASSDAINWSPSTSHTTAPLYAAAFGNGTYVAVGSGGTEITTQDGTNWTPYASGTTNDLNAVVFRNGRFIAAGAGGTILTSDDAGFSWQPRTSGINGSLSVVGQNDQTVVITGGPAEYITSADGINWTNHASGSTRSLLDVAYGHGTFVAVGGLPPTFAPSIEPSLLTSPDGIIWTAQLLATNANFYGVSFVNDRFIAVGDSGLIMTSLDGIAWTVQTTSGRNRTSDIYPLGGVAFGNGTYVAMDQLLGNYCLVSTDATTWATNQLPSTTGFVAMDRVHFENGLFVAGGSVDNSNAVLTSTNGVNWTTHITPVGINDLAFGAGRWVGVGDLAGIMTSTDALKWTTVPAPAAVVAAQVNLHGIVYRGGFFLAVGDSGTVLTSADGLNWVSRSTPGAPALNAVAYGNGSFVTVGLGGNIWQSGATLNVAFSWQPTGATIILSSPAGLQSVVQTSSDLIHWSDLFSIPVTQESQTLIDTNVVTSTQRFYRAIAH